MRLRIAVMAMLSLAVVILLAGSAYAVCLPSEHEMVDSSISPESVFSHYEYAGHAYNNVMVKICWKCGYVETEVLSSYIVPHDFSVYHRTGEHSGNGYHELIYRCSDDNCCYIDVKLTPCNGPPCMKPIERKPEPETEIASVSEKEKEK